MSGLRDIPAPDVVDVRRRHAAAAPPPDSRGRRRRRTSGPGYTLYAQGEPMVWLTGGALVLCVAMIAAMVLLIIGQGLRTFWPVPVTQVTTLEGDRLMGEVTRVDRFVPGADVFERLPPEDASRARAAMEASDDGLVERRLVRTGNFELTGTHFHWVSGFAVTDEQRPPWAIVFERREWGRFYGVPVAFTVDGAEVARDPRHADGDAGSDEPSPSWAEFTARMPEIRRLIRERYRLEQIEIGRVNRRLESARLALRKVELRHERGRATDDDLARARVLQADRERAAQAEYEPIAARIAGLNAEIRRPALLLETADGREKVLPLADIVRAYPANQLTWPAKLGVYLSRWREFLLSDPREANTEGGVFPAIFGTVVMTLIMTVVVVPFGVLAALYLREYAKAGAVVSAIRIAVNNLAGVPSIVFGVFGLGFFCYIVGWRIDTLFYEASLPRPTYGKGGILWAAMTLALLTLPVVIVATEEALAAVPRSMREGSYACGASKWQTIARIVLPRAMPGIMTGMILAMARGAGEVAPLMLVGAVKLAPDLPVDIQNLAGALGPIPTGPLHPDRSFMHLGFHIYDVGFQSPNSEAAKPMVFTTTLLLITLIAALNLTAIWIRSRLRRRFSAGAF